MIRIIPGAAKNSFALARSIATVAAVLLATVVTSFGQSTTAPSTEASTLQAANPQIARDLYLKTKPSLVVVKYTWTSELASQEFTTPGVVISDDGLVMFPIGIITTAMVSDDQMKDFKIVIPSDTGDETELDATLQGRDERTTLAFVRPKEKHSFTPVKFVDAPVQVGQIVYSVGTLPRGAGYKARVSTAMVSAHLRGPLPQVMVDNNLAGVGAVVYNDQEQAIGYVEPRGFAEAILDDPRHPEDTSSMYDTPKVFIPVSDFGKSLLTPPQPDQPIVLPWVGCELNGLEKQNAEYFNLKDTPAIQIGDVVKNSPADKAGLRALDVIIKVNGKPIERGDLPGELRPILTRQIQRMNIGDTVVFTVIREKGKPPVDISLVLEAGPKEFHSAKRYYAKDVGLVVREVLFGDVYRRKLPTTTTGVVVALMRPQAAAQAAKLNINDLVTQMNGKPITDLDEFKKDYQQYRKDSPHDPIVVEAIKPDGQEETLKIEPPQTDVVPGRGDDSSF